MIISDKHGRYESPHDFPNDLRPNIIGNWELSGISQNFNFVNTCKKKKQWKTEIKLFP